MKELKREDGTHLAIINIIESERGWGSKVDGTHIIQGSWKEVNEAAEKWIEEFNSRNDKDAAPEIYWRAELVAIHRVGW